MKLAVAIVGLLLVACVPAAAGERTHIVHRAWKVELNWSGRRHSVEPGGTVRHCPGDEVSKLYFRGQMVHPSRKDVHYYIGWSHNRAEPEAEGYLSTERHGWIRESYGIEGIPGEDQGFEDGRWTARFRLDGYSGEPIGRSSIRLKTRDC